MRALSTTARAVAMPAATVRPASHDDLPQLAELFDLYRQFYGYAADRAAASAWLQARLAAGDAALWIGFSAEGEAAGLCQMYRSLCSLDLAPIWILNDLFVRPSARGQGLGRRLMNAAQQHAEAAGASRLELTPARTNLLAQQLYASQGWVRDPVYLTYTFTLPQ